MVVRYTDSMTGKSHQIIGLSCGLAAILFTAEPSYQPATFATAMVAAHLGALMPDFDTTTGDIWDSLPLGHVASHMVDPFIKHRNLSHSLLGTAIFVALARLLLMYLPSYWGLHMSVVLIAFTAAYLSHLVADMVTVEGVPLFFPYQTMIGLPPEPFESLRIITGKWFENLIVFPLANVVLIGLIWTQWPTIRLFLFR